MTPSTGTHKRRWPRVGPGWLVAAAFIGPGTVTTATVAGAGFGTALLWALFFSTIATMALQEMAARLGLVTGTGLGEAMRSRARTPLGRWLSLGLIVGAIGIGNAAYETGNLLGGGLGLSGVFGGTASMWALAIGVLGAALLWTGSYKVLERVMVSLVGIMALVFLGTVVVVFPPLMDVVRGMFVPAVPTGSLLVAVGLIGTTVVPYNLFLHASTVSEKWGTEGEKALGAVRSDLALSIGVGGAVSMAILLTSAGTIFTMGGEVGGAGDMARQLEPLLGSWARVFFGVGLFAAGMTSAVTAPLAGINPVAAILFAQAANGILLPVVAIFLLVTVNDPALMGERRNRLPSNLLGGLVVLIALALGARALLSVTGLI